MSQKKKKRKRKKTGSFSTEGHGKATALCEKKKHRILYASDGFQGNITGKKKCSTIEDQKKKRRKKLRKSIKTGGRRAEGVPRCALLGRWRGKKARKD